VADELAYNNHDVDDGLRSGLLSLERLDEVAFFRTRHEQVLARYPGLAERRLVHEIVRRMIDTLVNDLIDATAERIRAAAPRSIEDVRAAGAPLAGFGDAVAAESRELKRFLNAELYRHPRVLETTRRAQDVVRELFAAFMADSALLPPEHAERARRRETHSGAAGRARAVADYIAGMTDRYAQNEHARLHGSTAE
jgi:dGTPase